HRARGRQEAEALAGRPAEVGHAVGVLAVLALLLDAVLAARRDALRVVDRARLGAAQRAPGEATGDAARGAEARAVALLGGGLDHVVAAARRDTRARVD